MTTRSPLTLLTLSILGLMISIAAAHAGASDSLVAEESPSTGAPFGAVITVQYAVSFAMGDWSQDLDGIVVPLESSGGNGYRVNTMIAMSDHTAVEFGYQEQSLRLGEAQEDALDQVGVSADLELRGYFFGLRLIGKSEGGAGWGSIGGGLSIVDQQFSATLGDQSETDSDTHIGVYAAGGGTRMITSNVGIDFGGRLDLLPNPVRQRQDGSWGSDRNYMIQVGAGLSLLF